MKKVWDAQKKSTEWEKKGSDRTYLTSPMTYPDIALHSNGTRHYLSFSHPPKTFFENVNGKI